MAKKKKKVTESSNALGSSLAKNKSSSKNTSTNKSGGVSSVSQKKTTTSNKNTSTTKSTKTVSGTNTKATTKANTSDNAKGTKTTNKVNYSVTTNKNSDKKSTKTTKNNIKSSVSTSKKSSGNSYADYQNRQKEKQIQISKNHQSLLDNSSKVYKSGNAKIDKQVEESVKQNKLRNGQNVKTSKELTEETQKKQAQGKANREKLKSDVTKLKNDAKTQLNTLKENFTDPSKREKALRETSTARTLNEENYQALSKGQTGNVSWTSNTAKKINLNDAAETSKIVKRQEKANKLTEKNLEKNALLKDIAETNALFAKGTESAVANTLEIPSEVGRVVGRVTGNKNLENASSRWSEDMRSADEQAAQNIANSNSMNGTIIGDVAQSMGNMVPQTLLGIATGGSQLATLGLMGANVYAGNSAQAMHDYMQQGNYENSSDVDNKQFARAQAYALANALKEVGTEKMNDVVPGLNKLELNQILEEGGEELVGGLFEPYIDQILTANSFKEGLTKGSEGLSESIQSGELAKQGLMGSLSAVGMNMPYYAANLVNSISNRGASNAVQNLSQTYELAKEQASVFNDAQAIEAVEEIRQAVNKENGELSSKALKSTDVETSTFAKTVQEDAIRSALEGKVQSKDINNLVDYANKNGIAVEIADNVEIDGVKADVQPSGDGFVIDSSVENPLQALKNAENGDYGLSSQINSESVFDVDGQFTEIGQNVSQNENMETLEQSETNNTVDIDKSVFESGDSANLNHAQKVEQLRLDLDNANSDTLAEAIVDSDNSSEDVKQAVKEAVKKKVAEVDDNVAVQDLTAEIAEETVKSFSGLGKTGDSLLKGVEKTMTDTSEGQYETLSNSTSEADFNSYVSKFTDNDGNIDLTLLADDLESNRNNMVENKTRDNGTLANDFKYWSARAEMASEEAFNQIYKFRDELKSQGYEVTIDRVNSKDKIALKIKDAEGNTVKLSREQQTKWDSLSKATVKIRSIAKSNASVGGYLLNRESLFSKHMSTESAFETVAEAVEEANKWNADHGFQKNGKGHVEVSEELISRLENAESGSVEQAQVLEEIAQSLSGQMPKTLGEKVRSLRYINMLSAPATFMRNIAGNTFSLAMQRLSNPAGALWSKIMEAGGVLSNKSLNLKDSVDTNIYKSTNVEVESYLNNLLEQTDGLEQKQAYNKLTEMGVNENLAKKISKFTTNNFDNFKSENSRLIDNLSHMVGSDLKTQNIVDTEGNITNNESISNLINDNYNKAVKAYGNSNDVVYTDTHGNITTFDKTEYQTARQFIDEFYDESKRVNKYRDYTTETESSLFNQAQEFRNSKYFDEWYVKMFGKDVNVNALSYIEKWVDVGLNNEWFGDDAFVTKTATSEFARYLASQNLELQVDETGKNFSLKDESGNVLDKTTSDQILTEAYVYADIEAKETTFHQYSFVASKINEITAHSKAVDFLVSSNVPFLKTNLNMAKNIGTYSPFGLAYTIAQFNKVKSGEMTMNTWLNHAAKGTVGTGLVMMGALMSALGMINGAGADMSDDEKDYAEQKGWQSNSFNILGGTYTGEWVAPAGTSLFMGATFYETLSSSGLSSDDIKDIISSFTDPFFDQSMFSGLLDNISSAFDGIDQYNPDYTGIMGNILESSAETYATQFTTNALLRWVSKSFNEYKKSSWSDSYLGGILNQTINGIPGLSNMILENTVDSYSGEDVKNTGLATMFGGENENSLTRLLYNALSIGTYKKNTLDTSEDSYDSFMIKVLGEEEYAKTYIAKTFGDYTVNEEQRHDLNQYIISNYRKDTQDLFESGLLNKYDLDDPDDLSTVSSLVKNIKDYYTYRAQEKLYQTVAPDEADSVLTSKSKVVKELDDSGVASPYQIYYSGKIEGLKDGNGETITNSKALLGREYWIEQGLYDDIVQAYNDGKISDLSYVGLSKKVVGYTEDEYETKISEAYAENSKYSGFELDTSDSSAKVGGLVNSLAESTDLGGISESQKSVYSSIKSDMTENGGVVYNSKAKKVLAKMKEDGTYDSFMKAVEDGTINYDNITEYGLNSGALYTLTGVSVKGSKYEGKTKSLTSTYSSSSSSSKKSSSSSSSSSRKSSSSKSSSSSSSSSSSEDSIYEPEFILASDAFNNIGSSSVSSGLTDSELQSLYNEIVSGHSSNLSTLQSLVNKGKV